MARAKKAPIVRNIINDAPNTYRAINRMNGIVTMIEHTSEDDIKAYELEPTYRELGGGGGGAIYHKLTIKFINISDEYYVENKYLKPLILENNEIYLSGNALNIAPSGEADNDFLYMYWEEGGDSGTVVELNDIANIVDTAENPVNCEYDMGTVRITNPTLDSSITLKVEGGR